MAFITEEQTNIGLFLPTTNLLADQQRIAEVNVNSEEFKNLLVSLYQFIGSMATAVNQKDTGYYVEEQFVTGEQFFNPLDPSPLALRQGFRKTINFGALPNTGSKSVAHGIPIIANGYPYSFYFIRGAATDPIGHNYIPINYASASGTDNIELKVDATNVTITTASDRSAFTNCLIVLAYLQS